MIRINMSTRLRVRVFWSMCLIVYLIRSESTVNCKEYKLPEIDVGKFKNGNQNEQTKLSEFFDKSLHNVGAIKLINHGISSESINSAYAAGKRFFHLSDEEKLNYKLKDTAKCGYTPVGGLSVPKDGYDTTEEQRTDYDFSEMYFIQLKQLKYGQFKLDIPTDGNDSMLYTDLMLSSHDYILKLAELRKSVNKLTGMALKLENVNYFEDVMTNPDLYYPVFVYLYYPTMPKGEINDRMYRIKEHTDAMTWTFAMNDDIGGLQLFIDNEWQSIQPSNDNAIILFGGDAINVYTNNWWQSTSHRVIFMNNSDTIKERLTMSYFVGPDYDQLIHTLDCDKCNQTNTQYGSRTVVEHFRKRFDGAIDV